MLCITSACLVSINSCLPMWLWEAWNKWNFLKGKRNFHRKCFHLDFSIGKQECFLRSRNFPLKLALLLSLLVGQLIWLHVEWNLRFLRSRSKPRNVNYVGKLQPKYVCYFLQRNFFQFLPSQVNSFYWSVPCFYVSAFEMHHQPTTKLDLLLGLFTTPYLSRVLMPCWGKLSRELMKRVSPCILPP